MLQQMLDSLENLELAASEWASAGKLHPADWAGFSHHDAFYARYLSEAHKGVGGRAWEPGTCGERGLHQRNSNRRGRTLVSR